MDIFTYTLLIHDIDLLDRYDTEWGLYEELIEKPHINHNGQHVCKTQNQSIVDMLVRYNYVTILR